MKRLLTTTAVLMSLSGAAYADAHTGAFGTVTFEQGDFYASDLIGMRIYNSETEMEMNAMVEPGAETEWDDIGEINDIIVSQDGQVRAVILGVGGFLGIGERDVSVPMDAIKVVREKDDANDRFLVVTTSKEALEKAPAYEREMTDATAEKSTETASTTATTAAATTTTATAQTDGADAGLMRPAIQRDGYAETDMTEMEALTAEKIEGSYVYGANDETVGEIDTLVMTDDGKVSQVVINVGGFLGIGEKPVAVSFDKIQILKNQDGDDYRFYIDSTKERLEALPEYNG